MNYSDCYALLRVLSPTATAITHCHCHCILILPLHTATAYAYCYCRCQLLLPLPAATAIAYCHWHCLLRLPPAFHTSGAMQAAPLPHFVLLRHSQVEPCKCPLLNWLAMPTALKLMRCSGQGARVGLCGYGGGGAGVG